MITEDRNDVDRDIEETLGLVPEFFRRVPDYLLPTEWASFKSLQLSDQTAIPNKYKELIGLAVSGATRCRYCCYFHTEAARLFGATEDEITETALMAKATMGWSTYLNTMQFDYDEFVTEFDQAGDGPGTAALGVARVAARNHNLQGRGRTVRQEGKSQGRRDETTARERHARIVILAA